MEDEAKRPLRGNELLRAVVNKIIEDPKSWDQGVYHCDSRHCVAGWAQILGGNKASHYAGEEAKVLLGLEDWEREHLFGFRTTFGEIYNFAAERLGRSPSAVKSLSPADYPPL